MPDSVLEGFEPEEPLVETHAALDNFRRGVWAKHGQTRTICYMEAHVKPSGRGAPHLGSSAGDQFPCQEPSDAAPPSGHPSSQSSLCGNSFCAWTTRHLKCPRPSYLFRGGSGIALFCLTIPIGTWIRRWLPTSGLRKSHRISALSPLPLPWKCTLLRRVTSG